MVTVSEDEGMNGLVGAKTNVVGVVRCHVPATGGLSVGMAVLAARGVETLTVMVPSEATLVAALAGVVLTTVSGALETTVLLVDADGEASAVVAVIRTMRVDNPAITSAATTAREIRSIGRRRAGR
jgi:hypothetical protein